jgi:hypothetical protein
MFLGWTLVAGVFAACGSGDAAGLKGRLHGTGGEDSGATDSGASGSSGAGGSHSGSGGRGSGGVTAVPPCANSLDCTNSGALAICNPALHLCVVRPDQELLFGHLLRSRVRTAVHLLQW